MCTFSIQFSSVAQSCPTLCNPMDCSTPGLSVHHQRWFKDVERETRRLKMTHSLSWCMFRPGNFKTRPFEICSVHPMSSTSFLLKLMSIGSVMTSNHFILCCPLFLPPWIFPASEYFDERVSSLHQVAKLLDIQLQHHPFQWTFRTDFL